MTALPNANLLNPLVISALMAAATTAAVGLAVPPPESDTVARLAERLVHNPFVLGIGFAGIWALAYGLLQLWATGAPGASGLAGWIMGTGPATEPVFPGDTTLAAGLFAERWDYLAARRMAPMAYAVWLLPLLGFIGTVIGISDAIGGLGTVFAEQDRQEALEAVLGALRFAFDTTFAGLVLVIPVMALSTLIGLADARARDRAIGVRFAPSEKA